MSQRTVNWVMGVFLVIAVVLSVAAFVIALLNSKKLNNDSNDNPPEGASYTDSGSDAWPMPTETYGRRMQTVQEQTTRPSQPPQPPQQEVAVADPAQEEPKPVAAAGSVEAANARVRMEHAPTQAQAQARNVNEVGGRQKSVRFAQAHPSYQPRTGHQQHASYSARPVNFTTVRPSLYESA